MLHKPTLALTENRSRKALLNCFCGDPEYWFDSEYFQERGVYGTSFDFFVNWKDKTICDEVWIKRISDSDDIYGLSMRELLDRISAFDGKDKANRLYKFLEFHRFTEKYMLFQDVSEEEWASGRGKVIELDPSKYKQGDLTLYNAEEIQEKIKSLRKRSASIGKAGMIYSTSYLEGYLSKKPFFWPGDADTVLFNAGYKVEALIEFKKHTASSKIPFQDQKLENYLKKDRLKYDSLALLRDRLQTKLFVLYYPIPSNIHYMILEEVSGGVEAEFASARYELPLPKQGSPESMRNFAGRFLSEVLKI